MEENVMRNSAELKLNESAIGFLKETAKWANFLAIMGFVGIVLMVLIAFFMGTLFTALPNADELPYAGPIMIITYLIVAFLYFFPILYMYRFATKMKVALNRNNQEVLNDALMNLKSHYKFIGILTIVFLAFYTVILLLGLIAGLAAM
ncbi:MAG: hypothetical protein P8H13_09600 [Polaribacter sp.]|nr:hypothetical protein [Polaribacter sp.]MDG1812175.1 hypothetical protein [Polaribacter sp.]MDG1994160.1 hypothetical protein [Polaribacter sp.]